MEGAADDILLLLACQLDEVHGIETSLLACDSLSHQEWRKYRFPIYVALLCCAPFGRPRSFEPITAFRATPEIENKPFADKFGPIWRNHLRAASGTNLSPLRPDLGFCFHSYALPCLPLLSASTGSLFYLE